MLSSLVVMVGVTPARQSKVVQAGQASKRTAFQVLVRLALEYEASAVTVHWSPVHLPFRPPAKRSLASVYLASTVCTELYGRRPATTALLIRVKDAPAAW